MLVYGTPKSYNSTGAATIQYGQNNLNLFCKGHKKIMLI